MKTVTTSSPPALGIEGGTPVRTAAFPVWPHFAQDEIDAATRVLSSGRVNYWTGSECRSFEAEFAQFHLRRHGIALANGTVALELALYALGISAGDEVIVPARTFIASASCVVARGAIPIIADVDSESQNITAATIERLVTPRTRAVIAVHLAGWPCDMDTILELARKKGLYVIEDCAQSHGARYRGKPVGSFGDLAAFSFCNDKILTTAGEGGMLLVDDEPLFDRAWSYKDHGKNRTAALQKTAGGAYRWLHDTFGTNWRMTEIQAAVGRAQFAKLPRWLALRRRNAARLRAALSAIPALRVPQPPYEIEHACYKFHAFLRPALLRSGWTQRRVIEAIQAEGVPCTVGTAEIHRERAFADACLAPAAPLPVAKSLGETGMTFLVHPTLGDPEMQDTCAAVKKVMAYAAG